jgi:hypothetical protein
MFLYLIERPNDTNYDEYESAVVVANTEDEARNTHPSDGYEFVTVSKDEETRSAWIADSPAGLIVDDAWIDPRDVKVTLLGVAHDKTPRVVCSSYNAG